MNNLIKGTHHWEGIKELQCARKLRNRKNKGKSGGG